MAVSKKAVAGGGGVVGMIIAAVLALEGGYVNHPSDPGGETNMGITKRVAVEHGYVGPMKNLPEETAADIYTQTYIDRPGFRPIIMAEPAVGEELVDTAVNMGQTKPIRWFQQSLNDLCGTRLTVDGRIGPATQGAYVMCQTNIGRVTLCVAMLGKLDAKQQAEYARLVRINPSLSVFYKGWLRNRIGNVERSKCGKDL